MLHLFETVSLDTGPYQYFLLLISLAVYLPIACLHFRLFHVMKYFDSTNHDIIDLTMGNFKDSRYSNKTQVYLECCGVNGYADWEKQVPFSCCVDLQKPNCTHTLSEIHKDGCAKPINTFVKNQVMSQSLNFQIYCSVFGCLMIVACVVLLIFSRKIYQGRCKMPNTVGTKQANLELNSLE